MSLPVYKLEAPRKEKKRYVRKDGELFDTLQKIKLWPSRSGTLHGIRSVVMKGAFIEFTTHCGQKMRIKNSKNSRVARWLRHKWYVRPCPTCKVPTWKLEKYSSTTFQ
ncbi:MAG: pyrrolysine--tRNA(Pyl) ligase small subunit [Thermodesulfovibrionales bacterium]